jgi:hypothetical protein
MRVINIYILLFLLLVIACEKDAKVSSKYYPFIMTKEVTDIDTSGATFEAEILKYGQDQIIDFGFKWDDGNTENQNNLINITSTENFKLRINTDLVDGKTYTVRAYVKTTNYTVLGNEVTFTSLGSMLPEINDFSPKEGFDGTKVMLVGKYYSQISFNNKVFVNNKQAKVIYSSSDTIVFITPSMAYFGNAEISVQVGSSKPVTADINFKILGPEIKSVSSLSGHSGEYVLINGENFIQSGIGIKVYFDSDSAEILQYSATQLEIIVPPSTNNLLSDKSATIKVVNGMKTVYYKDLFTIEKSWDSKQTPPFETKCQAFTFDQKVYIITADYSKKIYEYDPISNQWYVEPSPPFPGSKYEGGLYIEIDGKLYCFGGYNYLSQPISELSVYDLNSKTWTKKNDLPFKFVNGIYFNLNNQIIVVTSDNQVWRCDLKNEQYSRLNDFPVSFKWTFASTFVGNDTVFVVTLGHNFIYNSQNDTWIEKSTNNFHDGYYMDQNFGFSLNSTGYVVDYTGDLYKYDILKDRWILTSRYAGCRGSAMLEKTICTIGDKAYIIAANWSNWSECVPSMFSYNE